MLLQKMGIAMRAAVRSQINLVMAASEHIKQLKGVRDIIYPILWFQVSSSQRSKCSFISFLCSFRVLFVSFSYATVERKVDLHPTVVM
jgi:hypothetical protein